MLSDHSEWEAHTKIVRDKIETDLGDYFKCPLFRGSRG